MTLPEQNIRGIKRKRQDNKESKVPQPQATPTVSFNTNDIHQEDKEAQLRQKLVHPSQIHRTFSGPTSPFSSIILSESSAGLSKKRKRSKYKRL